MRETRGQDWEDPLEKGRVTHSSIFTWGIPWIRGAWQATVHGVAKELDTAERLTLRRISLIIATKIISYLLSQIINYFSQFKKIHLMEYTYTGYFQFYSPKVVF